ncbi:FecR family protein [Chitinophaga eiseniae]|uniref:FecR family protein n=1 Tax=Chitinophaga eiseniae TaxID=634771 RepID=A0A847SSE4_9BACT|nr:FecR family protein [Chitinophaga eiseniae]NLR82545.1 FecR family protein [Chitinophaga eiseniae]
METKELAILSEKYLAGKASEEETNRLLQWYNAYDEATLTVHIAAAEGETEASLEQRMHARLLAATLPSESQPRLRPVFYKSWRVAAAVVLLLGAGITYYVSTSKPKNSTAAKALPIAPGGDKATLTLSDGSVVNLDTTGSGWATIQGSSKVQKTGKGEIIYQHGGPVAEAVSNNVLRTPRGGQFKIKLPDGTDAWLNASSSISYPTAFAGKERAVTVTGEVYFEVAPNAHQPFSVKVNNMEILVLGTHFNVNAYPDESTMNTTLLEGAVLVRAGSQYKQLDPGQQARVMPGKEEIVFVKKADVNNVMAWKNGYFSFDDADIPTVMRQLSRWYNIEVSYAGKIPEERFTGEIGRSLTQEQLLKILAQAKIQFKVEEGRKLIIYP